MVRYVTSLRTLEWNIHDNKRLNELERMRCGAVMCNVIVNGKDKDLVESIHMCSQGSERHRVLSQVMQSLLLASLWFQTQTQLLDNYDSTH